MASWNIFGASGVMIELSTFLLDQYIRVFTPLDSSDHLSISARVLQGAIWSQLLFKLYIIHLLPGVIKQSLVTDYADDHTLAITIPYLYCSSSSQC